MDNKVTLRPGRSVTISERCVLSRTQEKKRIVYIHFVAPEKKNLKSMEAYIRLRKQLFYFYYLLLVAN